MGWVRAHTRRSRSGKEVWIASYGRGRTRGVYAKSHSMVPVYGKWDVASSYTRRSTPKLIHTVKANRSPGKF